MKYAHLKLFFPTALLFLALPAAALAAPAASGKLCGTGSSHQESASRNSTCQCTGNFPGDAADY